MRLLMVFQSGSILLRSGKDALQNAASLLADYLIPHLKDAVLNQARVMTVKVTNVSSGAQLNTIEVAIKKMTGIESVERRSFSQNSRTAILDITTYLRVSQVAQAFTASRYPRFSLQSSTGQMLSLRVVHFHFWRNAIGFVCSSFSSVLICARPRAICPNRPSSSLFCCFRSLTPPA